MLLPSPSPPPPSRNPNINIMTHQKKSTIDIGEVWRRLKCSNQCYELYQKRWLLLLVNKRRVHKHKVDMECKCKVHTRKVHKSKVHMEYKCKVHMEYKHKHTQPHKHKTHQAPILRRRRLPFHSQQQQNQQPCHFCLQLKWMSG
jgi:hypothetical protein